MVKYDKSLIHSRIDATEVCDRLGIEISYKGGRKQCLCPKSDHEDNHLGSCIVKDDGCYCFACGEFISMEDMVMETLNVSYPDALGVLASWTGVGEVWVETGEKFPLTAEDMRLLGLYPTGKTVKKISGSGDFKRGGEKKARDMDGSILLSKGSESFSLKKLYKEDKNSAKSIILGKLQEKADAVCEMMDHCGEDKEVLESLFALQEELVGIYTKITNPTPAI